MTQTKSEPRSGQTGAPNRTSSKLIVSADVKAYDIEQAFADHMTALPPGVREATQMRVDTRVLAMIPDDEVPAPEPFECLDLTRPPEPPDWVVEGLFARKTVSVINGDTGSAKSLVMQALAVAGVLGEKWLDRKVNAERVLYFDEENPQRVVLNRLVGLGVDVKDPPKGLQYVSREGTMFGVDGTSGDLLRLKQHAELHNPDLIVVDTTTSATAVPQDDNDEVPRLIAAFKAIAELSDCAVILLRHNKKHQAGGTRDESQLGIGATAWRNQPDFQASISRLSQNRLPDDAGAADLHSEFRLRLGGKDRELRVGDQDWRVVIDSHERADGTYAHLAVKYEGEVLKPLSAAERMLRSIEDVLKALGGEGTRADIVEALPDGDNGPIKMDSGNVRDALRLGTDSGRLAQDKARGPYSLPSPTGGLDVG